MTIGLPDCEMAGTAPKPNRTTMTSARLSFVLMTGYASTAGRTDAVVVLDLGRAERGAIHGAFLELTREVEVVPRLGLADLERIAGLGLVAGDRAGAHCHTVDVQAGGRSVEGADQV